MVDASDCVAEALAVRGDWIIAVGTANEIGRYRFRSTGVIDLGSRSLILGLIDSHTQLASASMIEWDHPIPEKKSIPDLLHYVKDRGSVFCQSWQPISWYVDCDDEAAEAWVGFDPHRPSLHAIGTAPLLRT